MKDISCVERAWLYEKKMIEKTIAETAEICGISVENAKIRIHRAKTRLKEVLDSECVFYKTLEESLRCDRK